MSNLARNSAPTSADTSTEAPASKDGEQQKAKREYRHYTKTQGRAFINAITRIIRDGRDTLYFAKVGLLTGRELIGESDNNRYRDRVQFLDLLVGGSLKTFVEKQFAAVGLDVDDDSRLVLDKSTEGFALDGVLFNVEILDLHFTAEVSEKVRDRAFIHNNGVLASLGLDYSEGA